jgi:hypothetical protein
MYRRWLSWITAGWLAAFAPLAMPADAGPRQVVGDVVIYLGVLPADMVRGHPPEHPEGVMHGGAPAGESHVMVALFERASGRRITDAAVEAAVSGKGMERSRKSLEPMTVAGALTYGNYFTLLGPGPYRIEIEIRVAGLVKPVRATFFWARA